MIHPTAVIDPQAELDASAEIGPFVVIEGPARIGRDTRIRAHCVITGHTTIGAGNDIGPFASIGAPPQDLHYGGEPTEVVIGDRNQIREYVSIHRGTAGGRGRTTIGDDTLIMAYSHIAHDCVIGDHVILTNLATLAGHVEVQHHANIGGMTAVHQRCRIGAHAFVGGMSGVGYDIPPYVIMAGARHETRVPGINKIGLRRAGFGRETIAKLEAAFRILFRTPVLARALDELEADAGLSACPEVRNLIRFCRESKRGITKRSFDD